MDPGRGRFRRPDQADEARRGLRSEILAQRRELELLAEALRSGPAPISAQAALDRSFVALRAAERAWLEARRPSDLLEVITRLEASREALAASLQAVGRRQRATRA